MSDFESDQATADEIPWTSHTADTLPYLSPGNGAQPKATPYVWVTWMSKIIAGEAFCEWSLWFRARYSYTKLNAGADLTRWTQEHDDLVRARERDLRLAHVAPRLEQGLTVQGRLATISGKPDIRYDFDGSIFFEDAKTGKHRDSDHVQVLLYIWLWKLQTGRVGRGGWSTRPGSWMWTAPGFRKSSAMRSGFFGCRRRRSPRRATPLPANAGRATSAGSTAIGATRRRRERFFGPTPSDARTLQSGLSFSYRRPVARKTTALPKSVPILPGQEPLFDPVAHKAQLNAEAAAKARIVQKLTDIREEAQRHIWVVDQALKMLENGVQLPDLAEAIGLPPVTSRKSRRLRPWRLRPDTDMEFVATLLETAGRKGLTEKQIVERLRGAGRLATASNPNKAAHYTITELERRTKNIYRVARVNGARWVARGKFDVWRKPLR